MAHVSGNATWTQTASTPIGSTQLENIEGQLDYVRPMVDNVANPSNRSLLGWSYDPQFATPGTSTTFGSGAFYSFTLRVGTTATATGLNYFVLTAGVSPLASSNWLGLYQYNSGWNLIASTADLGTTWASTGVKSTPFTSTLTVTPGLYVVGAISNWNTTNPQLQAVATVPALVNLNTTTQGGYASGSYTTLPSTRPGMSGTINSVWFGLY